MIRRLLRRLHRRRAFRELQQVGAEADGIVQALARALETTLRAQVTNEESGWIRRIESLREALLASSEEVAFLDFGARGPAEILSAEAMRSGRVTTRSVSGVCRTCSKAPAWCFALFRLIRELRPSLCLELGTCLGISAAYQAAALSLNGHGSLVTLEGADTLAAIALRNFTTLSLQNIELVQGRFADTLDTVLSRNPPIGFAFVDGHHDEEATVWYFERLKRALSRNGVVVLDDISWSPGMQRAWIRVQADPDVDIVVNLGQMGICVLNTSTTKKYFPLIPIG